MTTTPPEPVPVPDANDVKAYLSALGATSYTDDQYASAHAAEVDQQARACRVEPYNASLAEALCRRVQRNLAMRALPLGVQMDEAGGIRIGTKDPEVRRLEGPYRRAVVG